MRPSLLRRLQTFFSSSPASHQPRHRRRPRVELLEDRLVLTSTLYVDFGDRFPVGGMTGTVDELINTTAGNNPAVNGPDFTFAFNPTDTFTLVGYNRSHSGTDLTDRGEIMTMIRRYYEPYDITVVELTENFQDVNGYQVRGARDLDDISATLGLNEGELKNNDTYALVGTMVLAGLNLFDAGLLGISNGTDIYDYNFTDGTVLNFMAGSGPPGPYESNLQMGLVIAHEAGHSFGMKHTLTAFQSAPIDNDLATTDIMSYFNDPFITTASYGFFSHYPMVAGDGNSDPDFLNSARGHNTPYDQFVNDPQLGKNADLEYVTGTGQNDIITLTKTGANEITVTVSAFTDDAYSDPIPVPKVGGTTYTYTIPADKRIIVDGGHKADRIVLDASIGQNITVRGMEGTDELVIDGMNADTATYTPSTNVVNGLDGLSDLRGSIVLTSAAWTTTINFQEFETDSGISLQNVGTLTYTSPGGADSLTLAASGALTAISGTVANGVAVIPFRFGNVQNLVLDAAANETTPGNDDIRITGALSANVTGSVTIRTGAGNDTLTLTNGDLSTGADASGAFLFDAGSGNDTFLVNANTVNAPANGITFAAGSGDNTATLRAGTFAMPTTATAPAFTFDGGDGVDTFGIIQTALSLPAGGLVFNAGAGDDRFNANTRTITVPGGVTGTVITFNAGDGDDVMALTGTSLAIAGTFAFTGGLGNDTLTSAATTYTLAAGFTFTGGDGNDSFTSAMTAISLTGGATGPGFTFTGGLGDDALALTGTSLSLPAGGFVFTGGDGSDRLDAAFATITLPGGATGPAFTFTGDDGDDVMALTAGSLTLPVGGFVYSGGNGNDRLEAAFNSLPLNLPAGTLTAGFLFDGDAGDDVLSLTAASLAIAAPFTFTGDAGNDGLEIAAAVITLPVGVAGPAFTFIGNGGNDYLKMTATTLTVPDGGFVFDGGDNDDTLEVNFATLAVAGGGTSPGFTFNAGGGSDTLKLNATTLALPLGGFVFDAGAGDDSFEVAFTSLTIPAGGTGITFNGAEGNDSLELTAASLQLPTNAITYNGGDGNDSLSFAFATVNATGAALRFNGGAGTDTLTATGGGTRAWAFSAVGTGTMNVRLAFSGVENLTSGSGNDSFVFAAGARLAGVLDAGGGVDALSLAATANITIALGGLGATDGFNLTYAGGPVRNINRVVGGGGANTLVGMNGAAQWVVGGSGGTYTTASRELTFAGFSRLRGGSRTDALTVDLDGSSLSGLAFDGMGGSDSAQVTAGAGNDTFVVGPAYVLVNGRQITLTRVEGLSLFGEQGNDTFTSASASLGMRTVAMYGGAGNDTFTLTPAVATVFRVFGDANGAAPGDVLNLKRGLVDVAGALPSRKATSGTFSFVGRAQIIYAGIERYNEGRGQILPE